MFCVRSLYFLFNTVCPSSYAIILMGEESVGCFALTIFLMSCESQCSVALPHGAVGWSTVCDCNIS